MDKIKEIKLGGEREKRNDHTTITPNTGRILMGTFYAAVERDGPTNNTAAPAIKEQSTGVMSGTVGVGW